MRVRRSVRLSYCVREEERPVLKGKGVRDDGDRDIESFKSNKVETKHQMVGLCSLPFNLPQQLE
ncbi:Uncharacterized protein DAT39_021659, partial [Clarias magur]